MDETYQTYVNRVVRQTLPETYQAQLQNIQESPKFRGEQAVPFPGYSVITPPWREDPENSQFYSHLEATQQKLLGQLEPGLMVPVPATSFHVTVADLIWESAFQSAIREKADFEQRLRICIKESFQQYRQSVNQVPPLQWQLLGVLVFTRALGVALVPKDEQAYERILQLRRSIYQNSQLIALGIEQQYHFTAHVTLGYFSQIPEQLDRDRLGRILSAYNDQWLETEPQVLTIQQAELRKFNDMTRFERKSDWPVIEF